MWAFVIFLFGDSGIFISISMQSISPHSVHWKCGCIIQCQVIFLWLWVSTFIFYRCCVIHETVVINEWLFAPFLQTCLTLYAFFFPISLVRVTLNKKLSAPVSWIQMSAPAAALCSLTIMAQPSFSEEYPDITQFQRVHRMLYLPVMHFLFATCLIGAVSSVHSLTVRWDGFIQKKFSPAHAAFCFPTLSHANAIQSYRSAIIAFSDLQSNEIFMRAFIWSPTYNQSRIFFPFP